tara:strand:+ start:134 stop:364 length:231 start_codon:yes stop_codon:yes gene_type:complete
MTQRDDGHDFRDSKNKAEAYDKKKKSDREQAQRLVDKWSSWQYDAYESNKSTWIDEDDRDCKAISKLILENKSKFA